jgi:hypothetical protein
MTFPLIRSINLMDLFFPVCDFSAENSAVRQKKTLQHCTTQSPKLCKSRWDFLINYYSVDHTNLSSSIHAVQLHLIITKIE